MSHLSKLNGHLVAPSSFLCLEQIVTQKYPQSKPLHLLHHRNASIKKVNKLVGIIFRPNWNKYVSPHWRAAALLVLMGVFTASCSSMGGERLVSSHTSYNDSVQLAVTREVLTNIVRARYADPMQFITVQSINAQFSVSTGASAGAGQVGAGAIGDAGASIGYSESPTITFTPEVGSQYFEALYGPLSVNELVAFVIMGRYVPGDIQWESISLSMLFASVNGASDIVGNKSNEIYVRRILAIAHLLDAGGSLQQIPEWDKHTSSIAKSKVLGEDMVAAGKASLYWLDEDGGKNARLARQRMALALQLAETDSPKTIAALSDLDLDPGSNRYFIRSPVDAKPEKEYVDAIWVTPRSMAEVIMVAGGAVEVPPEHNELVPQRIRLALNDADTEGFRIQSARECPNVSYSITHRGFCFYVDDRDVSSKQVLEGLVSTYMSRMGGVSERNSDPQVVIPVG